jgi:hypothetical protein
MRFWGQKKRKDDVRWWDGDWDCFTFNVVEGILRDLF